MIIVSLPVCCLGLRKYFYVKPALTELSLYHTVTADRASTSDRQPSCGRNGLHVGYTTLSREPRRLLLCFPHKLLTKSPLHCGKSFRFCIGVAIFHNKATFWPERGPRTGGNSLSPKRPYRLWGPPNLWFSDVPGFFPGVRRSEYDAYHSQNYTHSPSLCHGASCISYDKVWELVECDLKIHHIICLNTFSLHLYAFKLINNMTLKLNATDVFTLYAQGRALRVANHGLQDFNLRNYCSSVHNVTC
jgi:hypothetical protein